LRENSDDDPFCSAVCSALGLLDADSLPSDEKEQSAKVLQDLYVNAPGGATHSASGWALRQWGLTLRFSHIFCTLILRCRIR